MGGLLRIGSQLYHQQTLKVFENMSPTENVWNKEYEVGLPVCDAVWACTRVPTRRRNSEDQHGHLHRHAILPSHKTYEVNNGRESLTLKTKWFGR